MQDVLAYFQAYLQQNISDISNNQNANSGLLRSFNHFSSQVCNPILKDLGKRLHYAKMVELFGEDAAREFWELVDRGVLYFHDADKMLVPYCFGASTGFIAQNGRPYGQLYSVPPRRADSFIGQAIEYTMDLSQEFAGAVALGDVFLQYARFSMQEQLTDKEIENDLQRFVHIINNPFRIGGDSMSADTLIQTYNEKKKCCMVFRMEDFVLKFFEKDTFSVFSLDPDTGRTERKMITGAFEHTNPNKFVRVTLDNGMVVDSTENHSIFGLDEHGAIKVFAPESRIPNVLVLRNSLRVCDHNENYNWAYLCGAFVSGSNIKEAGDKKYEVVIKVASEKALAKLERVAGEIFSRGTPVSKMVSAEKEPSFFLTVTLNENDYIRLTKVCGKGSYSKKVPSAVVLGSPEMKCSFLAGYLDTRGTYSRDGFSFYMVAQRLRDDLLSILLSLGVCPVLTSEGKVSKRDKSSIYHEYKISFSSEKISNIRGKMVGCDERMFIYRTPDKSGVDYGPLQTMLDRVLGIHSQQGYYTDDELQELLKKVETRKTSQTGEGLEDYAALERLLNVYLHYYPVTVKSVEPLSGPEFTKSYDVEVEGTQNYVVNGGIVVHNSPFTNVSLFDRPLLKATFSVNDPVWIEETIKIQKIFGKFLAARNPRTGMPYRFPICTVNLLCENGKFQDTEFLDWFCGIGNEGVFNIYLTSEAGKISSCCRLVNDVNLMTRQLNIDSFGNGGVNIGSTRVITLNLYKMMAAGLDARDMCDVAGYGLKAHRRLLEDMVAAQFLKFFSPLRWFDLDRMFFSTIGFIGLFEACDGDLTSMRDMLTAIKSQSFEVSKKHKMPVNVEQVPGETAAIKMAQGTPFPILSNQYLPLWYDFDLNFRLRVAGEFDRLVTGGAITHLNVGMKPTPDQFRKLVQVAADYGVSHFAINPVFSSCSENHVTVGEGVSLCGICGSPIVNQVTRIVGYFAPVANWNPGRREEFKKRVWKAHL